MLYIYVELDTKSSMNKSVFKMIVGETLENILTAKSLPTAVTK